MHALNNTTTVTGDIKYVKWALELAQTIHPSFIYQPNNNTQKKMYWKMSINLKHPLILSMGQHDPLDGFIKYNEIKNGMKKFENKKSQKKYLENEFHEITEICKNINLTTDDPLGIGGLLFDAIRITQLITNNILKNTQLLELVLDSSILSLKYYTKNNPLEYPKQYRLAFRELGLVIGLKGLKIMIDLINKNPNLSQINSLNKRINILEEYLRLGNNIENFWINKENRNTKIWIEHRDINMVMLATALEPHRFLRI
ncbi:MAG: hypothetical protein PHY59_01475 [Methanobacterium sp.]|nr:hypothetical protein [Methanobacterium sp.]